MFNKLVEMAKAQGWTLIQKKYPDGKFKLLVKGGTFKSDPESEAVPFNLTGFGDTLDEAAGLILEALKVGPQADKTGD